MKILIVSDTTKNNYKVVKDSLAKHDVCFACKNDYVEKIKDFEYIIAGRELYSKDILEKAKKLRVISRCGHGTDAIDKDYCREHGIVVLDARGSLDDTMADVTIGYMIMALRRLKEIDSEVREDWKPILGNDLTGKTVGIVGLGGIGTAVAKRLQGFKTHTVFYDIDSKKQRDYPYASFVSLKELFKVSDVVTLHCDLNDKSRNMINAKSILLMDRSPLLINTARGELIDMDIFPFAFHIDSISYCVFDVYPVEPLPFFSIIKTFDNVILGSHSACFSVEGQRKLAVKAVGNLLRYVEVN